MKKLTLLFVLLCSCALASQNPQPAWFRVIHDRELTEFVKKEATPILRVAGVKPSDAYWFRFYVADLAQRGIAGMNNGKQMVYMDRAHTKAAKEDIAGKMALHVFRITLAHEIAHDVLGHVPNVQALSDTRKRRDSNGQNNSPKNKIINNSTEDILSEIGGLAEHVEATMNELSRISKDLSPSYVVEVGFSQAIRLYVETFSKKTGIQVDSYLRDLPPFQNSQQEIHLYRIAQEVLTNIAKHAEATKVEIRLRNTGSNLYFSINDNGKGFDLLKEGRVGGMGLIGIRERVNILGGKVWIESDHGSGTTIRMEIPYELPQSTGYAK